MRSPEAWCLEGARCVPQRKAATLLLSCGLLLAGGCASPGHPSPPSLQIPRVVTDLVVTRSGEQVHLRWTTPARTTDGIDLKPPITAEICRASAPVAVRNQQGRSMGQSGAAACSVVQNTPARPGISEAVDTLPADLAAGQPTLLSYRVQLRGALGKTAGPSAAAFTASGAAPAAVADLHVTDTRTGALVQWTAQPAPTETVELSRKLVSAGSSPGGSASSKTPSRTANLLRSRPADTEPGTPGVTLLSAGQADAGGALDRAATLGATYEYSAQRVLTLLFGTRTVQVRSAPSGPVRVTMRDVFPPPAPAGLLATPGPGSIDLSWEPETEARLAGYRVYRSEAAAGVETAREWSRLTPDLLTVPAFRDLSASAGKTYSYRVTAVDTTGNESLPSAAATETAPAP